jgi:hypothetical protein
MELETTRMEHLDALELRLSHERGYLAAAKTTQERELRAVWIAQIEREISCERTRLGMPGPSTCNLSDDELLDELFA